MLSGKGEVKGDELDFFLTASESGIKLNSNKRGLLLWQI